MSAFVLLAIWLAATQHCGLEAAGVWEAHNAETADTCCSEQDRCTHDGCEVVEGSSVAPSTASVKTPVPALQICHCVVCAFDVLPALLAEPTIDDARVVDGPLDWVPTWHFERRAAQSPRAPSSILV